jgi:ribosomal protein S18 acetylase RimI-like enzyme
MAASQPARALIHELRIRALELPDLPAAAEISASAFDFDISDSPAARRWQQRLAHLVGTDPDGGFVAERDGRMVGVAQAMRRERLWCLSLLAVSPELQSGGAGRELLAQTLGYGAGTDAGLIVSSNDPRALRVYALAGFSLHPTLQAEGPIDRRALPRPDPAVREGDASDLEGLAAISREVRGAPYTSELEFSLGRGARLLRIGDRGFAVTDADHGVWQLAARDEATANSLLWSALEGVHGAERPAVRWITGEQRWAIDVALQAGLRLGTYGALAVRGRPGRLWPYIPSAAFA